MDKNYSYTYLLPLIADQVYLDDQILSKITNTYMFFNEKLQMNFYFLCNFNYRDPEQTKLETRFTSSDLFVTAYETHKGSLYEFKFPEEYKNEYLNFKEGRYSKFHKDAKISVLDFWSEMYGDIPSFVTGSLLRIKQILYKDDKLRQSMIEEYKVEIDKEAELGNKINISDENFNFTPKQDEVNLETIKKLFD